MPLGLEKGEQLYCDGYGNWRRLYSGGFVTLGPFFGVVFVTMGPLFVWRFVTVGPLFATGMEKGDRYNNNNNVGLNSTP